MYSLSRLLEALFFRTTDSKRGRVVEWRGVPCRESHTMFVLPALEDSGTSGSSKSGGEVGKGLVSLVGIRQGIFRELADT